MLKIAASVGAMGALLRPESMMSPFSEALMARAIKGAWVVVSMKNDWKRIFAWQS
jgi:hypothetical protein